MKTIKLMALVLLLSSWSLTSAQEVKENIIAGPDKVKIKVRMEGPYSAETPLQIVCYFKYTADGAKCMAGAPVELDKHLGGVINSLRERGEFMGDELETLLIIPPEGSIKAKALLLIGLGDEAMLSLEKMERVGKVALREASNLGAQKVAFAPLIRDQGNAKLGTGDIAAAVLRGVLLAQDTQHRMHQQGLGKAFTLEEWTEEAGPAYFDETTAALQKQVKQVESIIATRVKTPYKTK